MLLALLLASAVQQDDKILERGEQLLEEAKVAYEDAKAKGSAAGFVDAGFKLEEARIKYIVLQEIGSPERQKLAGDRLRAVNQLAKLIHDGRVAISGTPAESSDVKPPAPSAAPTPPPAEPAKPEPATPVVDVTKRAPMPDTAKQKDAEKAIRDLFKDQYAKKAPADRRALARTLLDSAARSQGDLPGLWVLCREAQEVACQACDVRAALEAVDTLARTFDVDALALRAAALLSAGKAAKAADEYADLVAALLRLIDEYVAADQYDAADKAAAAALQHARKTNDLQLGLKASTRAREIAEAKTLYTGMKNVLEAIAKNPEDPAANLEMGKFLCFAKGNWDLGLRFLVKGADASLKALAEKDLAAATSSVDLASVADSWWDLADKDKSPLRKGQMQAHCKTLYEAALPGAPALLQMRIQKRLDDLDAGSGAPGPVNLLSLIDPARHQLGGSFQKSGAGLLTPNGAPFARVEVPYQPPAEYDLALTVERRQGTNSFIVGLIADGARFCVMMDAGNSGDATYIDGVGEREASGQLTRTRGKYLDVGKPTAILISVRKAGLTLSINGAKMVQWKGDYKKLGFDAGWTTPTSNAMILGSWGTEYLISKALLTPVSGQGKRLR